MNQFQIDAHMAHHGLRFVSRCVDVVRDILFNYQTRCILIATSAIWSNVHQHMFTFSQTKWFTEPLDISHCKLFNSGWNDFHFSSCSIFRISYLTRTVRDVLNFLEIIQVPHICTKHLWHAIISSAWINFWRESNQS